MDPGTGLTEKDVERVQQIFSKYIPDDQQVFVSDVPLETARQIEGVQAVSGDTYPDPTRVVSIGVPFPTLVDNVSNKDWWNYSIEFCGGTHVNKMGEIQDMVVLEESGIAKGVRRIVAVTGKAAKVARRNAARLEKRLDTLGHMSISPEKQTLVKQAQAELATSSISLLDKRALSRRIEDITKEMLEEQMARLKVQVDAAITLVETAIELDPARTSFVVQLPGADCSAKVISEATKQVPSRHGDKSTYFIEMDGAAGRVSQGCFVAQ